MDTTAAETMRIAHAATVIALVLGCYFVLSGAPAAGAALASGGVAGRALLSAIRRSARRPGLAGRRRRRFILPAPRCETA